MTERPREPRETTPGTREEHIDLSRPGKGAPSKGTRAETPIRQKVEDKTETTVWEAGKEDD